MQILTVVAVRAAASALGAFALLSSAYALPVQAAPLSFDIGPQSLASALNEFARQSRAQLLFAPEAVARKGSRGVHGSMEPIAALQLLLKDSGLSYSTTPGGAILIGEPLQPQSEATKALAGPEDGAKEAGKNSSSQTFRVAQLDQAGAGPQAVDEVKKEDSVRLEEIVVTGSRIPLAAGQKQVQPVQTYTREDIARSGQGTLGEFLNTLPDVSTVTNASFTLGSPGMQTVQLHGLPVGTTLTLLDGRRLEINSNGFFDLSNIPVSAIERIEILPIGASAIYGADSLAGAVNTILRKDFSGFEVNTTLDHAPGVNNPRVDLAWGGRGEHSSVSLIASYESRDGLLGIQREPTSLTSLPAGLPAGLSQALVTDTCAPGNVYSADGVSKLPGLSSSFAAIPAGIFGAPTLAQFAASAGKSNVCNAGAYFDITPESQRESALLSAHYNVAGSTDLFTEVLLSHQHMRYQSGPQLEAFATFFGTVAADNPYNAFGQPVNVSFAFPGTGTQLLQSQYLIRPTVGVRGSLFSDWHYEATATVSRDRAHNATTGADFVAVEGALSSSDPATALNPFTSGAPGSPQLLNSLMATAATVYDDRLVSGQAIFRGPILQLPAGTAQGVIVGEYGQERMGLHISVVDNTVGGLGSTSVGLSLQRTTDAVSGEARIPLLARDENSQRGERLTLTLAARSDHSSDYGSKATWQGALLWRTTEALSFTGSYGTSYRAPHLNEIAGPQTTSNGPQYFIDPFRGNEVATYNITTTGGPNFNLKPETGGSYSLAAEYSNPAHPGLKASLNWYKLDISNYIAAPFLQTLIDFPNLFPGAVVRAPPNAQDQANGFLGQVTQINGLFYNYGALNVRGFDADLSYALPTPLGEFTPSLAIANVYRWQSALTPGVPSVDGVSKANLFGTGWAPRWKGTVALAWKRGPLSANVAGRYIGRYLDYQEFFQNTHETGDSWVFDVNTRYEVGQTLAARAPWLAGGYIALGAVNVFNKTPPFTYTSYWYDFQEYDGRGRFVHLNVGVRF
jgi:iron complex outermembrane receptor protein